MPEALASISPDATPSEPSFPAAPLTLEVLRQRAQDLLPQIREGAAQREQTRELPTAWIRRIARAQLVAHRIPQRDGGPGASVRAVIEWVIALASVDSNIAQALRPGFLFLEGLLAGDDEDARRRWLPRLLAGAFVGNAGWEIGGASGAIATRLRHENGARYADGSKYYSTGALYSDWLTVTALDEQGHEVRFILPREREGLALLDDFDAMGQRLTASGTTHLRHVRVEADEVLNSPLFAKGRTQRTIVTPFAQLFLAAVEAGVARNALDDAVHFAREHARPIKHSTAQRAVDDPYVAWSVGEISAQAFAAEAAVLRAADSIDAAWAAGLEDSAIVQASIDVAQAQYVAAQAALQASERLFDVGGASVTARQHNLDRHWRNARTVANHNPRHWKAAVVGAYRLKGEPPPLSGLF